MKKILLLSIVFIFFASHVYAGQYSGNWIKAYVDSEKCDIVGTAELVINYSNAKIKIQKWRWLDSNKFKQKLFKGKIRKNNIDIFLQSRALGYKHILQGIIKEDKIFLTFSSTHTDMNAKLGGCSFEFIKG